MNSFTYALKIYKELINKHKLEKNHEGKSLYVAKCDEEEVATLINYIKFFNSLSVYNIKYTYNNDYIYFVVRTENHKELTKKK